jgi:hypothetical protein
VKDREINLKGTCDLRVCNEHAGTVKIDYGERG